MPPRNPFRTADGEVATMLGRDDERRRATRALTDPSAKLLLLASRRMGKSTVVLAAAADAREAGSPVVIASLTGISCLGDVASRILTAATIELSPNWHDATGELVRRLGVKVTLEADSSGTILPSIDPALRRSSLEEQHTLLRRVLDSLDELARAHDTTLGIALEEIQELFRVGGSSADWALASAARQHGNLGYILSSSEEPRPRSPAAAERSPLSLFETLRLPHFSDHQLAAWIDDQLRSSGIKPQATGDLIVALGKHKLGNVAQIAAYCFDSVRSSGFARAEDVRSAFASAVADCADLARTLWESLTTHQQNVLRALAHRSSGLTTAATRDRFSLGDTGTTYNSAQLLVRKGVLERSDGGYVFESPFVRGWVIGHALSDAGITLPITHVPSGSPANTNARARVERA